MGSDFIPLNLMFSIHFSIFSHFFRRYIAVPVGHPNPNLRAFNVMIRSPQTHLFLFSCLIDTPLAVTWHKGPKNDIRVCEWSSSPPTLLSTLSVFQMNLAYLIECTRPTDSDDAKLKSFMISRQRRWMLRDTELYKCSNCGIFRFSAQFNTCSGCKSLKGRYCNKVCQQAHWSSHKATCLSIRAASHEALVSREILGDLGMIMIRELKIPASNSLIPRHGLKVACALTSTDIHKNEHQFVHGGSATAGEDCFLTFISFTPVPLDSIPAKCYVELVRPQGDTPITIWFVVEELGDIHSPTSSLLDLSFAVTWSTSTGAITHAPMQMPIHPILDNLRYLINRYIRVDEKNVLRLRAAR
ncbi:hypothetical protein OF83DRAFT_1175177 [Amylostereum chailletii]|nr:hypothetical protein OF83DRAFT_1175177 [Amylostereum chailletii]